MKSVSNRFSSLIQTFTFLFSELQYYSPQNARAERPLYPLEEPDHQASSQQQLPLRQSAHMNTYDPDVFQAAKSLLSLGLPLRQSARIGISPGRCAGSNVPPAIWDVSQSTRWQHKITRTLCREHYPSSHLLLVKVSVPKPSLCWFGGGGPKLSVCLPFVPFPPSFAVQKTVL